MSKGKLLINSEVEM